MIIRHKNYKDMSRDELVAEGKKRGLDRRLLSFKGVESAGEQDRIEIIRQLNLLDQQKDSRDTKLLGLISIVIGTVTLIVSLVNLVVKEN